MAIRVNPSSRPFLPHCPVIAATGVQKTAFRSYLSRQPKAAAFSERKVCSSTGSIAAASVRFLDTIPEMRLSRRGRHNSEAGLRAYT